MAYAAVQQQPAPLDLKPVVDQVFAFEQLREALDHLKSGQHFGKVCIGFRGRFQCQIGTQPSWMLRVSLSK